MPGLVNAAAERNKGPILEVLNRYLPAEGEVLEIASGSGQHIVHFAAAHPELSWQPTDADTALFDSIDAHVADAGLANVKRPLALDVMRTPWPVARADVIVCINMIHISPWQTTPALLAGAARLLPPGGCAYLYGPYRRNGAHTAPSNEAFDASLRARDPSWGLRDMEVVAETAAGLGLVCDDVVAMPANNFSVIFRRSV